MVFSNLSFYMKTHDSFCLFANNLNGLRMSAIVGLTFFGVTMMLIFCRRGGGGESDQPTLFLKAL